MNADERFSALAGHFQSTNLVRGLAVGRKSGSVRIMSDAPSCRYPSICRLIEFAATVKVRDSSRASTKCPGNAESTEPTSRPERFLDDLVRSGLVWLHCEVLPPLR